MSSRPAGPRALPMTRSTRLTATLAISAALVVVQVVVGAAAHSTGLLADAGHNLTDVLAIGLSLVAVRWAMRPRSDERSFGNHRATILAALANSVGLTVVTGLIVAASVERLVHPQVVDGADVVIVAAVALVANTGAAVLLRTDRRDLNVGAALLHMAGDALASLAVLVAGVVIMATGWDRADPIASLVVALLIVLGALRLTKRSVDVLLESTPRDVDLSALREAMTGVPGVVEVHDLHVWSLSSEVRALSAHLVLEGSPSLAAAQQIAAAVRSRVNGPFDLAHTTFELEGERCAEDEEDPCGMDALTSAPLGAGADAPR